MNTNNYITVDLNYQTSVNYFVRKNGIASSTDEHETFTSATIEKTTQDYVTPDG
jgi:hypothetical protein